jgi:hypothetical protein
MLEKYFCPKCFHPPFRQKHEVIRPLVRGPSCPTLAARCMFAKSNFGATVNQARARSLTKASSRLPDDHATEAY